ncbi:Hsp33 family molecular chaperone [Polycladidibacter stylochi]|uniref:Hsp33 family molecular chaperone n=1 Tax=Polycladidibacter stylochi TaxID=1807766 RepID=UPI00082F6C02|nr:Hsp33 family molecular chaperone [Pseudovibrio stylochi]
MIDPKPAGDDAVLPFAVEPLDIRGRVVKMGPELTSLLLRHQYPEAVNKLLAEAIALTSLLGSTLKNEGRLTLQAQSDGAVSVLVVDFNAPHALRATARYDSEKLAQITANKDYRPSDLLGKGHLALTIEQGANTPRYQGVVVLDGKSLEEVAHSYFMQSEQIPTRVRLGVAQLITRDEQSGKNVQSWRAGGVMVQYLPKSEDRQRQQDIHPGDAPEGQSVATREEADAWMEARALIDTVKDDELTDPALSVEELLYRLFHEHGVSAFESQSLKDQCTCSEEKITNMLKGLPQQDREEIQQDPIIEINCDFCSKTYKLDPKDVFK